MPTKEIAEGPAATNGDPLTETRMTSSPSLVESDDYYLEGAMIVFTARYHLRRGYCCESGCRHCPFGEAGSSVNQDH